MGDEKQKRKKGRQTFFVLAGGFTRVCAQCLVQNGNWRGAEWEGTCVRVVCAISSRVAGTYKRKVQSWTAIRTNNFGKCLYMRG